MYPSTTLLLLATLALMAPVRGAPTPILTTRHEGHEYDTVPNLQMQNGLDAQKMNAQFATIKATDSCKDGAMACVTSSFAQCVAGKWEITPCTAGTVCLALPLVNSAGTSLSCDSEADALARFTAAGVQGGLTGNNQTSQTGSSGSNSDGDDEGDDDCSTEEDPADNEGDSDDDGDLECSDDDGDDTDSSTTAAPVTSTAPSPVSTSIAFTTVTVFQTVPLPSGSATPSANLNRRQTNITLTFVPADPSTVISTPAEPTVSTPANTVIVSSVSASVPSSSVPTDVISTPTTSVSAGVEPTAIVIGTDGIRTVTVVSTVTVGCGAATIVPTVTASSIFSSPPLFTTIVVPISSSVPPAPAPFTTASDESASTIVSSSPLPTMAPSGLVFSSSAPSSSSIAVLPTLTPSGLVFSSSAPSSSSIAVSSPTAVNGGGAGGFSFSTAPTPTAGLGNINMGDANNGAGAPAADLSKLLTATVGSY